MFKAAINSSPSNGSTPSNGNTPAIGNTPSPAAEQKMYGYIRVSTREQNEARQVIALREFGVPEDCVFMDKQSGKDSRGQRIRLSWRPCHRGMSWSSKASTGSEGIITTSWNSGG